jgi:hypothetical protein
VIDHDVLGMFQMVFQTTQENRRSLFGHDFSISDPAELSPQSAMEGASSG